MVFDAVRELGSHCTPDEVYARVQRKSSAVNRATVYRTLDFLLKLGLVTTAHIRDNQVIYELAGHAPHHHLVCQQCDGVEMIDHALLQPLFNRIEREFGFEVKTDHFMIFGVCKACQKDVTD
jgi:Fur family ferric uptake transcriptional regulator